MGEMGVVTPQVPLSSDVILGEFKVYANKGLPNEILIGSTRGGAKVDILREIREIAFDGAYGPTLDEDGNPLVRHDKLFGQLTLEQMYLRYYNSMKLDFNDWQDGNWLLGEGGTATQESEVTLEDEKSFKFTGTNTSDGIHIEFEKDLSEHKNGEAVDDTKDFIGFAIYIDTANWSALSGATLRLRLNNTGTKYFYHEIVAADLLDNQWNIFRVKINEFFGEDTPDWKDIKGASLIISDEKTVPEEVELYISSLCLVQTFTDSSIVPANAGNFKQEISNGDRIYTPTLEILQDDYISNITLVGQKHDGNMIKIIMDNCYNDGALSIALQEKDEAVNSTQFTTHYNKATPTKPPIRIRFYKGVA